ncbi:hypothetical protein Anapl_03812 [Anas platyrhynchos]|uniref:Uncharacterized protein n=1 Tax=Anas platyrhynchos TaxID=8839 RepID=R0KD07_ANAPL|nr:hypothetical protein Anapl_03812 [Anas platyrhynchos]
MQCITSQWHRSSAASVKEGGYCGLYHNKNKCWQASYLLTFTHVLSDSTVKCVQDLATERLLTCSQSPQSITWTACQANGFTHLVSTDPFATCIIHVYRDLSITCENAEKRLPENCEESNHEMTVCSGEGGSRWGKLPATRALA